MDKCTSLAELGQFIHKFEKHSKQLYNCSSYRVSNAIGFDLLESLKVKNQELSSTTKERLNNPIAKFIIKYETKKEKAQAEDKPNTNIMKPISEARKVAVKMVKVFSDAMAKKVALGGIDQTTKRGLYEAKLRSKNNNLKGQLVNQYSVQKDAVAPKSTFVSRVANPKGAVGQEKASKESSERGRK